MIGFGAGEPDFPTPAHIVEAAIAACRDPRTTTTPRPPGLPELRAAIAAKTLATRARGRGRPGARHQRRQAGRLRTLRRPVRPGRRSAAAGALLDDLSRGHRPRRRRAGRQSRPTSVPDSESPSSSWRRHARRATKVAPLRLALQPDRRRVSAGRGRGHRPVGRRGGGCGSSDRRDLRAPRLRRRRAALDAGRRPRARRSLRSSSTAWPRPTP